MKTLHFRSASQRGSALVTVLMLGIGMMILIASILGYSLTERRLNYREGMRLEARNAAEAVSEYGLSQVRQLMQSVADYNNTTRFTSAEAGIKVPQASFWAGGNVATSGKYAPELIIGLITPITPSNTTRLYYYSSTDPDNANDPLKGCYAFRFDIKVISKATVVPPIGGAGAPQTCYMTQTLSSRASPLFSYAVFYNMDMEISPGPAMTIIGAVHANGNLYARKNSSSNVALNFVGPVSVSGGVYANVAKYPTTNADGSIDSMLAGTDNVYYSTAAGGLVGMKDTSVSPALWRDQLWGGTTTPETAQQQASFRTWSSQVYQGNLQSSVHGIQPSVPAGIPPYNPTTADPGTPDYDAGNAARSFIAPALLSTETGNHTMDTGYDANVEAQKYARKSGLYIVVNPSTVARTGRKPDGSITNTDGSAFIIPAGKYRVFDKSGNELVLPGQPDYGIGNALINTAHTNWNGGRSIITIRRAEMTDMRRANFNFLSARAAGNQYLPKAITTIDVDITELKKAVDRTVNGTAGSPKTTSLVYSTVAPTAGNWANFIYNPAAVTISTNITDANLITNTSQVAAGTWNGGIYIYSIDADQQPKLSDNITTNPLYRGATDPSGVRLINGRGRVASAEIATASCELGLTIATNDALYILGHYNTDGSVVSTTTGITNDGLSNSGRYYETGEQPCSVISDALTILSAPTYTSSGGNYTQTGGWNDNLSALTMSSGNWSSSWKTSPPSGSNVVDGDASGPAGTGYTSVPTVTLSAGTTTATATASISTVTGQITGFTVVTQGSGYNSSTPPTVTITGGGGSGPFPLTVTVNGSGRVTGIAIASSIPFVLPYDRSSGLQILSTAKTTKFTAASTEISTAIMTGLVVSNKNGVHQAAGGVHNFPRFSEDWTGATCAIRGSLVAMYESRVANEPFSLRVYSPPTRLWGFNELFNQGKFPPLTPTAMSYRRIDFNDISASDYASAKAGWGL